MTVPSTESQVIDSLYRISSLVSCTEDPSVAFDLILKEVMNVLQASSASISLINPDTNRLEIEAHTGETRLEPDLQLRTGEGITGWVALHGKPLLVADVRTESRYFPANPETRSELAVPMEEQGMIVGVVNVESTESDAFDPDDLKILTLLTNEATRVVSKLWLIRQLKIKASQLEGLVGMGETVAGAIDMDSVLQTLSQDTLKLFQARICAIFLLDHDRRTMRLSRLYDRQHGSIPNEVAFEIENSAVGACIQFRRQIEIGDLQRVDEPHFQPYVQEFALVSLVATPIVTDEGPIGTIHVYTDVPHRFSNDERRILQAIAGLGAVAIQNVRLYQRVFNTEERLRHNEKLTTLGLLAAEIAHEIRNPLTVIKLLFQSLELEFPDRDPRSRDLQIITEKLVQLEETVGHVLSFGKTRQDMHARYHLEDLVDGTLALVRLKCRQQRIILDFEKPLDPLPVEGNKGQLQQAFLNLIINSTEAMEYGGRITVRCTSETIEGQPVATITVADEGVGVPDDIREHIFESFLTRKKEGTGLGLSIVKRIMRAHRGNVDLVQSSDRGTTFKCWLPLK